MLKVVTRQYRNNEEKDIGFVWRFSKAFKNSISLSLSLTHTHTHTHTHTTPAKQTASSCMTQPCIHINLGFVFNTIWVVTESSTILPWKVPPNSGYICNSLTLPPSHRWLAQEKDLPQDGPVQHWILNVVLHWIDHAYQCVSSYIPLGPSKVSTVSLNLYQVKNHTLVMNFMKQINGINIKNVSGKVLIEGLLYISDYQSSQ